MSSYRYKDSDGDIFHYKDKDMTILHREDGPAVELADGHKTWYLNGRRHRVGGPATEYINGCAAWYINDVWIFTLCEDGTLINRMR